MSQRGERNKRQPHGLTSISLSSRFDLISSLLVRILSTKWEPLTAAEKQRADGLLHLASPPYPYPEPPSSCPPGIELNWHNPNCGSKGPFGSDTDYRGTVVRSKCCGINNESEQEDSYPQHNPTAHCSAELALWDQTQQEIPKWLIPS